MHKVNTILLLYMNHVTALPYHSSIPCVFLDRIESLGSDWRCERCCVQLPLASRCGYIREQVSGINGSRVTHIDITGLPGGAAAFELVTKFCYGENFELTEDNVAMLRCAAEHLEMTDDDSRGGNLAGRTEAYLEAVALMSLAGAVTVLRRSEDLLPVSEEVDLVGRCVDAIAYFTCNDSQFSMSNGNGMDVSSSKVIIDDWLADELTSLRIDTFQRVVIAMKARGFKGIALGTLIMLYAQKSLRTLVSSTVQCASASVYKYRKISFGT